MHYDRSWAVSRRSSTNWSGHFQRPIGIKSKLGHMSGDETSKRGGAAKRHESCRSLERGGRHQAMAEINVARREAEEAIGD